MSTPWKSFPLEKISVLLRQREETLNPPPPHASDKLERVWSSIERLMSNNFPLRKSSELVFNCYLFIYLH